MSGKMLKNILLKLLQAADFNVEKLKRASSTLMKSTKSPAKVKMFSITRMCQGEGVQQALLKILEGTVASVLRKADASHPAARVHPNRHHEYLCSSWEARLTVLKTSSKERLGEKSSASAHPTKNVMKARV